MVRVSIGPGEKVKIRLRGTDGEFVISYGETALTITADLPDSQGREGVIYSEQFNPPACLKDKQCILPRGHPGKCDTFSKPAPATEEGEEEQEDPEPLICGEFVRPNPSNEKGITSRCSLLPGHAGPHIDRRGRKREHGCGYDYGQDRKPSRPEEEGST
jgi:hypothetical protein